MTSNDHICPCVNDFIGLWIEHRMNINDDQLYSLDMFGLKTHGYQFSTHIRMLFPIDFHRAMFGDLHPKKRMPKVAHLENIRGKHRWSIWYQYVYTVYIYIVYHIILSYKLIPMQRYKLYVFFSLGHIFFFIQPFFASEKSTFSGSQVRPRPGFHAPSVQELQILRRNSSSDPVDPVSIDWPFKISLW